MNAMARPGQVERLPVIEGEVGLVLPTSMTVLLSLCDHLTTVFLAPSLTSPEVVKALRFHTGSSVNEIPKHADFAVIPISEAHLGLDQWQTGTHEYPDRSTTLIVQASSFADGPLQSFEGPGIQSACPVQISGINSGFWAKRAEINAGYALGLDLLFAKTDEIIGCPRSTRVTQVGGR